MDKITERYVFDEGKLRREFARSGGEPLNETTVEFYRSMTDTINEIIECEIKGTVFDKLPFFISRRQ